MARAHGEIMITAISINQGIIKLIEPNGEIGHYRQKGIEKLKSIPGALQQQIKRGNLHPQWEKCPVIPTHYKISFEEPGIMGRAVKTFKTV